MTVRVYPDSSVNHDTYNNVTSCTMVTPNRCSISQQSGSTLTTNVIDVGNRVEISV